MLRSIIRILTFFGRWVSEASRQPGLMLSLVVGPFLILMAFGAGISAGFPEPRVAVVLDANTQYPPDFMTTLREDMKVVKETTDLREASALLQAQKVDAVVQIPAEPLSPIQQGKRAEVTVYINAIDPSVEAYTHSFLVARVDEVNKYAINTAIVQAQKAAAQSPSQDPAMDMFLRTPSGVLSSPFEPIVKNVAPFKPSITAFYAPMTIILLIQHLAVTLGALSMTRIRLLGISQLLRVSPIHPSEVVLGQYLSYLALCSIVAAILFFGAVYLLGVPIMGVYTLTALAIFLLIATGIGIGFVIALLSKSEQQAAQLVMLVLLASIFFSGVLFTLEQIQWPVQAVSWALPTTYAIRTIQNVMLRGVNVLTTDFAVLGTASVALFFLVLALLRREWRPS